MSVEPALLQAVLAQAGARGWLRLDIPAAALEAGFKLDQARVSLPHRAAVLQALGRAADHAALAEAPAEAPAEGPPRERLFDLLMRRLDVMQTHRAGVLALLRALPADPAAGLMLTLATGRSMAWMLGAAGISAAGPRGAARVAGLTGVWLWTLRAWQRDTSPDLAATMAALDRALDRVEGLAERWDSPAGKHQPKPFPEPTPDLFAVPPAIFPDDMP